MRKLASAYSLKAKMDQADYDDAVILANSFLAQNTDDELWMYCQTQKVNALIGKGDVAGAVSLYEGMDVRGNGISPEAMQIMAKAVTLARSKSTTTQGKVLTAGHAQGAKSSYSNLSMIVMNYPNPFNPSTDIQYTLPENAFVTLKVYNMLGQEVRSLVNEYRSAGGNFVKFDANNLPSGVYFYKLTAGKYSAVKKMLLMK